MASIRKHRGKWQVQIRRVGSTMRNSGHNLVAAVPTASSMIGLANDALLRKIELSQESDLM